MRVLLAGGSGFIGEALTRALLAEGDVVQVLTRNPERAQLPTGVQAVAWDARTPRGWEGALEQADALINLVGENIGAGRWTEKRKTRIRASRVQAGQAITAAVQQTARRPQVLIQASGIGHYGFSGDSVVTEASPAGSDFLAQVTVDWEGATRSVEALGVRWAATRNGLVLHPRAGIFPLVLLPFKLFAGGPLGSGRQWFPWIHLKDEVQGILHLLKNESAQGVYNFVAPDLVTNAQLGRAIARAMRRPYWLPTPAFALKLALGEMSTLILEGQRAQPVRLLDSGYKFRYPTLDAALGEMLGD